MANTITNTTLVNGSKVKLIQFTLDSDGSEETDLVVYDSSALAAAAGHADSMTCTIKHIFYSSSSSTAICKLEFDATTDTLAFPIPAYSTGTIDFNHRHQGIVNTSGTGKTGDITLTTTGLTLGDSLLIILEVIPN